MHPTGYIYLYCDWNSGSNKLEIATTTPAVIERVLGELSAIEPKTKISRLGTFGGVDVALLRVSHPTGGQSVGLWIVAKLGAAGWEVYQDGSNGVNSWNYHLRLTA